MKLVKQFLVKNISWASQSVCTLILDRLDPHAENEGMHVVSREWASEHGIPLDPTLINRVIEYTLTHRILTGHPFSMPSTGEASGSESWLRYSTEAAGLGVHTVLLQKITRTEEWSWSPYVGYKNGAPLDHLVRHILQVASASDPEFSPACSLKIGLTPEEYESCTVLLAGSVFDLSPRLVPMS